MILTRLRFKDFGRLRDIDVALNGPVIGLIGPNASGKSTIMKGIRFSFTGLLEGTQESYVRHFGTPEGAANAVVHTDFIKHGQKGDVMRQIGKNVKRQLNWNGEKKTSAKDVTAVMADIFSADKYAIDSAIFIQQAELDKLLFGQQTEREELFTRLFLLSHLEKIEDIVEGRIALIRHEIHDLTAVRDDLKLRMADTVKTLTEQQAIPLVDYSPAVRQLQRIMGVKAQLSSLSARLDQAKNTHRDKKAAYAARLSQAGITAAGDLDTTIQSMEAQADVMGKQRSELQAKLFLKQSYEKHQSDKAAAAAELEKLQRDESLYTKDDISMEQLRAMHLAAQKRAELDRQVVNGRKEMTDLATRMSGIQADQQRAQKALDDTEAPFTEVSEMISHAQLRVTSLTSWLAHKGNASENCPVCDRSMEGVNVTPELLAAEQRALDAAKAKLQPLTQNRALARTDVAKFANQYAETGKRIGELGVLLPKLEADFAALDDPGKSVEQLAHDIDTLQKKTTALGHLRGRIAQVQANQAQLQQVVFDGVALEAAKGASPDQVRGLDVAITEHNTKLANTRALRSQMQLTANELARTEGELDQLSKDQVAGETELADVTKDILTEIQSQLNVSGGNDAAALQALQVLERETAERKGRLAELGRLQASQQQQMAEIEEREKRDELKRAVIQDLEQLKQAFKRKGLPLTYIQECFNMLVLITQQNLSNMEANFAIEADPEEPVSFRFMRTDDATGFWMTQKQLSGGQRVRLTVAFLMAVQQLVLPEVGLLVLDEPSVHLDDSGVEQLRDLLISMSTNLQNTESQVIVCDHDPRLRPAFSSIIELT